MTRRQKSEYLANKVWKVLDVDGEVYEVDPKNMTAEHEERGTAHLQWVSSVIHSHRTANYTSISAFHKELRRGDYARAYIWAKTVMLFRKEKGLKEYLRSVLWEETRNIEMYQNWRANPGMPWEEMLRQFCGSTKKYEIEGSKGSFHIQVRAILDSAQLPTIEDGELLHPPTIDKYEFYGWMMLIHRCFERAFREGGGKIRDTRGPRMRCYKILAGTLRRSLEAEGLKKWTEPFDDRTDFDQVLLSAEKLSGLLETPDLCTIRYVNTDLIEADLAIPEARVFDGHTSKGHGLMRKWARAYPPLSTAGYRQPMIPGLDMRWSGQQGTGVAWRYKAFEQYGLGYKHVEWEDVKFGEDYWKQCIKADDHWFHYESD
jgi:hypothetical protein